MKTLKKVVILGLLAGSLFIPSQSSTPLAQLDTEGKHARPAAATNAELHVAYGNLPLSFIQNKGQVGQRVLFYEQGSGHATAFMKDRIHLSLVNGQRSDTITLVPLGGNRKATIVGEGLQEGTVNYFVGRDHTKWRSGIPTYQAVVYQEIYPGIDLKFYGNQRRLEYDVIVKPRADPSKVRFAYEGIEGLRVTEAGDLEIGLKGSTVLQKRPVAYQDVNGKRVAIDVGFKVLDSIGASAATKRDLDKIASPSARHDAAPAGAYAFNVASYDPTLPLIIDPVLVYSTYLGGSNDEGGDAFGPEFPAALDAAIEVDAFGYAYVTGATTSVNIGLTSGQFGSRGGHDAFVAKLNRTGTGLIYATYLGGSGYDGGHAIAIDPSGHAYLTGETTSPDFPTTPGAYDPQCGTDGSCNGGRYDAFVVKLSPDGTGLVYSTYLGGSGYDDGHDISVNAAGHAYVTGTATPEPPSTPDFPTTEGVLGFAYQGGWSDAFVTKFNPDGSGLVFSTYLGGSGRDLGDGIALDGAGNVYVTGSTASSDVAPSSPYDNSCGTETAPCSATGALDGYVAKLNNDGKALLYWTYLGGSNVDHSIGIDLIGGWKVYVTGRTSSTDFPTTDGAFDRTYNGGVDQFVTALNMSDISVSDPLVYSTFLGGDGAEDGHNLVLDPSSDSVYVNGGTTSADFPTTGDAVDSTCGTDGTCNFKDGYLVRLRADNTSSNVSCTIAGIAYNDCADLLYSTYLGGSGEDIAHGVAVDGWGTVYATGRTSSTTDFNTTPGASSPSFNGGGTDAFVAKVGRTPEQAAADAAALPIVNLHFHADRHWDLDGDSDYDELVGVFDEVGVVRACGGETHPFSGYDSLALDFAGDLPTRYYPYGGMFGLRQLTAEQLDRGEVPGNLNEDILAYLNALESQLRMGRLSGIGEVFPDNRHSHPDDPDPAHYPYNVPSYYPADSPLMQRLWALSAAFQIPLDVHMEATEDSLARMERLLNMEFDGRKGIWLWAHAGHYNSPSWFWDLASGNRFEQSDWFRQLLDRHDNLYVELSYRDFRLFWYFGIVDYNTGMLKPEWKDLLEVHSDRFVIGTDVNAADPKQYAMLITFWRGVLAQLTPEAAANITYRNAQGLTNAGSPALCAPRAPSNPAVNRTTVTFASVTTPGATSVNTSSTGPALPAGFQLGDPPTYFDITTTATYTPPATVCINYNPAQYSDPTALRLLHYESNAWTDVTISHDTGTSMICGQVSSLSPFIVAEPVADTTAPVLTVPATITTNATSPAGAVVTFNASATDNRDPAPMVTCTPPSGSTFGIGTTTVTCIATDAAGNSASADFQVIVHGAAEQITGLVGLIQTFNLKQGIENSLDAKLQNAQNALTAAQGGDLPSACNLLQAFLNEVQAQSGKAITTAQASQLIAAANQIKATLGCP